MSTSPSSAPITTSTAPRKWLARIGLLSIAGACAFALAGLLLVKERLHITIAEDTEAAAIDPVQLLRDDVAALRGDFTGLSTALEFGISELARTLDASAQERASSLERRIADLESALARLAAHEASPTSAAIAAAPETALPSAAPPPTPPTAAESASVLGFRLPTGALRFGEARRFQVLPTLSRVGFDAKSTLHDFTGAASGVRGEFSLALGDPAAGCTGWIEVESGALRTGVEGRDEEMRTRLATAEHPAIRFELSAIEPTEVNPGSITTAGAAVGRMTIAGETREIRVPVRLAVDEGRRVTIEGEWTFAMSEYGISPPRQLGVISVEDEVRAWLSLRARAVGAAAELGRGTP